MSGIDPNGTPPPPGQYVFPYTYNSNQGSGSVANLQQNWTQTTIKNNLGAGGGVVGSFSNAQNAHNALVKGRFEDVEDQIGSAGNTLGNHENRIIKLESEIQVAFYFSNDLWHKPTVTGGGPMDRYDFASLAGGGGGARSQPGSSTRMGWYGGAQGGYTITTITEASGEVDSSVNVFVGTGGNGAPDDRTPNGHTGYPGTNSYFTDSGGAFSVSGGGPGGTTTFQGRGSGNVTDYTACGGQAWGYNGAEVPAQVGGGGYQANGGFAGSGGTGTVNPGGNGEPCPSGKIGPGGGGGGGGPYSTGGNGGFPAGGGGAGGPNGNYADTSMAGPGGNGGAGFCVIISYPPGT